MSDTWIEAWLGGARFQRYLNAADGDRARALALYEWNVETRQIIMHDIAHFEVALRNAYDAAISANWPHEIHWLLHPESPAVMPIWRTKTINGIKRGADVNFVTRKNVDDAIKRSGYKHATSGKVIAELSLGFWRQLTTKAMEKAYGCPTCIERSPTGPTAVLSMRKSKLSMICAIGLPTTSPYSPQRLSPYKLTKL